VTSCLHHAAAVDISIYTGVLYAVALRLASSDSIRVIQEATQQDSYNPSQVYKLASQALTFGLNSPCLPRICSRVSDAAFCCLLAFVLLFCSALARSWWVTQRAWALHAGSQWLPFGSCLSSFGRLRHNEGHSHILPVFSCQGKHKAYAHEKRRLRILTSHAQASSSDSGFRQREHANVAAAKPATVNTSLRRHKLVTSQACDAS
jgi:hypothetical protein